MLREFTSYDQAQRLVDRLSDAGFPVEHVRIVGTGIRSVEQVTGRLTKGRAALAGAGTGAWFGLLFRIFTIGPAWLTVLLGGLRGARTAVPGRRSVGRRGGRAPWAEHHARR